MDNFIDEIRELKRRIEELEKRNAPGIPDPLSVSTLKTDNIQEKTSGAGVSVNNTLKVNNISERTSGNGIGFQNVIKVDDITRLTSGNEISFQKGINSTGLIKGTNTEPLRAQKVHRRVVFGWGAHGYIDYNTNWTTVIYLYYPFGYAAPMPQSGATRKIRLYAVYSDTVSDINGGSQVWVDGLWGTDVYFNLPLTWGMIENNRDAYSDWYTGLPDTGHGYIKIRTTQSGSSGRLYYMEIEHWDFFY